VAIIADKEDIGMNYSIDDQKLLWMYTTMVKIRCFEESLKDVFAAGRIPGFVHLYIGQEAIATGICACLRADDFITSNHRGHGHMIAKGGDPKLMMAELYGRFTGYCKGKGGSMHVADLSLGNLGANGIVGAGLPIAAGAALSAKYTGTDRVVASFFGDGASNQGTFHEALNLASIWKLPVIYVCENNGYAHSVSQKKSMNIENIADRSRGYGIPGVVVDGSDVLAVYQAGEEAVNRARSGNGATLIECKTNRHSGHNEGDPESRYRSKEEIRIIKSIDPISRFESKLVELGTINEAKIREIQIKTKNLMQEAVNFAEESPWPSKEQLLIDVYSK